MSAMVRRSRSRQPEDAATTDVGSGVVSAGSTGIARSIVSPLGVPSSGSGSDEADGPPFVGVSWSPRLADPTARAAGGVIPRSSVAGPPAEAKSSGSPWAGSASSSVTDGASRRSWAAATRAVGRRAGSFASMPAIAALTGSGTGSGGGSLVTCRCATA